MAGVYFRSYRPCSVRPSCGREILIGGPELLLPFWYSRNQQLTEGRPPSFWRTPDIEIEISNQCARLIANAIIYYNSAILSRLVAKYEASGNAKMLALIKKMSPAAWRHIHLNGHYRFRGTGRSSISMRS